MIGDTQLRDLGRRVLRDAAAATVAGKLASALGEILYDGLGLGRCYCNGCTCRVHSQKRYEKQITKLTEIQGFLEGQAMDQVKGKLGCG